MATIDFVRPDHVPADLVVPFDQYHGEGVMTFPPTAALEPGKDIFTQACTAASGS